MVALLRLWVLINLTSLVWCQLSECRFGGEQCICQEAIIQCMTITSGQIGLPLEFILLPLDVAYKIFYQNKQIPRIGKNSSLTGKYLDMLDLTRNKIEVIEQGAFGHAFIAKLVLNFNRLTTLEFMIDSLCELQELILNNNYIKYLEEEWFECKNNLSKLDLMSSGLISIESGVFCNMPNLVSLDMDKNEQLETIEPGAFCNPLIQSLVLKNTELTTLDFLTSSLCELQELNFYSDNIKYLKKEWFECKNRLLTLDLSYNRLVSIESGVFSNLASLVSLNLQGNNELSTIEPGAFYNSPIQILNLKSNNLNNLESLVDSLCQLKELSLNENKIQNLKKEWFECKNNLLTLGLSFNKLASIESGVFCNVPNLVSLNLDGNDQLETIEPGAFCNNSIVELVLTGKKITNMEFLTGSLCQLQKLNLEKNRIELLRKEWFACKDQLAVLNLNFNRIRFVESSIFSDLAKFSSISLKFNQIQTIEPFTFSNLINLASFDISDNMIKEIKPYAFNNLTSLESITSLANQFIQIIHPYSFVGLTRLFKLSFEGNLLTRLSDKTFVGLDSLTELNLKDNYLITIESGVFDDALNLEYLNLSLNQLIKIDKEHFSSLNRLTYLTLDQNRIEVIEPFSFDHQGESLHSLNLSYNKLGLVKKSHFASLRVLLTLDLSHNQISSIEQGSFENSSSLVELRLDHNCIFAIHKDLFKNLARLQTLSISNNVLIQLDPMLFRHDMSQLNSLNLSFNQIDSFSDLIFNNLKRLTILDLSNNRLKYLNGTQIFQGLGSLQYLDLSYNFIKTVSIQPVQGTVVSLLLGYNRLDVVELSNEVKLIALRVFDLSSNPKLNNASQLMYSLEKCQSCKYEFKFRNMSTQFIKDFVQYIAKSPYLVSKITSLDLSFNDLSGVIDLIPFSSMTSSLTELYLRNTKINSSVMFIKNFRNLKVLDLSVNQAALSKQYFFVKPYTHLYLSNTGFKNIATELNPLSINNLVELDLSKNLIEIVNRDNFNDKLQKLNLSYNRILQKEGGEFYFKGLCLDLSHNFMTSITIDYEKTANILLENNRLKFFSKSESYYDIVLNVLQLEENSLVSFPFLSILSLNMNRNNLTSIKRDYTKTVCYFRELSLLSNQIVEIEDNSFFYCKDLNHLDLSNNLLSNMTNQTFAGLLSLEYLNLSSNLIEFIRHGVFDESKLLKTLELNNNKIKNIMDKSFGSLIYLEKLYLDSLQMRTISNQTFEGLESVKFMKLNSIQFDSVHNLGIIKRLSKEYKSKNERYTWYPSTSIEYQLSVLDARYCSMVIFIARSNILINLLADLDQSRFLSFCRSFTLADLEYSKFGFE